MIYENKVILLNDIKLSSNFWRKNSQNMFELINRLIKLTQSRAKKHNGFIVKMMGDSFMISFDDVNDAISFTLDLNNSLRLRPLFLDTNKRDKIQLRTGICYGKVNKFSYNVQTCKMIDYFGNVVNSASRLESTISPVEGFAIGILEENKKDITELLSRLSKLKQHKVDTITFDNKCDFYDKRKRSSKLIHDISFRCENIKKLKKINNINVLKVTRI